MSGTTVFTTATNGIDCVGERHEEKMRLSPFASEAALERAAGIFRAAGDVGRMRLLDFLMDGERCVTEIAQATGAGMSTVSQQLRLLKTEHLVASRRDGKHIYYSLADSHIRDIIRGVLAHVGHLPLEGGLR